MIFGFTEESYALIETLSTQIRSYFGRFYLILGLACVLVLVAVASSPLGKYKLGTPAEKPAFNRLSWIAMLYSAGMGAGILLRAVQEPVFMQQNPPILTQTSAEIQALEFTFYQWGFTAWAFYAVFALAIGTVAFKYGRPAYTSSTVFSNSKTPIHKIGIKSIDILVILTTVFGLIAAIALGARQIKGGLDYLNNATLSKSFTLIIIILVGVLSLISALSGMHNGIKKLSRANIFMSFALLLFVFVQSDVLLILKQFVIALYHYVVDFIPLSLAYGSFNPGEQFLTDWTYYYWAFWIAWAPFTGIFIANISRGRTLREIIIGVLLIPSLGSFFWFTVFGQAAFDLIQQWGTYTNEFDNVFSSLFLFLSNYPAQFIINTLVILLLLSFLVTSLDSAILVLSLHSDRRKKPSKRNRILWGLILTITAIAFTLLSSNKEEIDVLNTMQKLLIVTSLPLSFFMVWMLISWIKNLIAKT